MKWYEFVYYLIQLGVTIIIWYITWVLDVAVVWIIMAAIASWYIAMNPSFAWKNYAKRWEAVEYVEIVNNGKNKKKGMKVK